MQCSGLVTIEMLLRRAVRFGEAGCASLAVDLNTAVSETPQACGDTDTLSRLAKATDDAGRFYLQPGIGAFDYPSMEQRRMGIQELANRMITGCSLGMNVIAVNEDPSPLTIDCAAARDCSEAKQSIEEKVRLSFVVVSGYQYPIPRIHIGDAFAPITCDTAKMSWQEIVSRVLVPTGDGHYAWSVLQEA